MSALKNSSVASSFWGPSLEAVDTSSIKAFTVASESELTRRFIPDTTKITLRHAFHELGNKLHAVIGDANQINQH